MHDWLCFSSTDLLTWQPHGAPLDVGAFSWSKGGAKGSKVVERNDRFWWFVSTNHASVNGGAIRVAVADGPTGPFEDAAGAALITNDMPCACTSGTAGSTLRTDTGIRSGWPTP